MADTKRVRKLLKMTQREFAIEFGIKPRTVENWDYRKTAPEFFIIALEKYIQAKKDSENYYNELKKLIEEKMKGDSNND